MLQRRPPQTKREHSGYPPEFSVLISHSLFPPANYSFSQPPDRVLHWIDGAIFKLPLSEGTIQEYQPCPLSLFAFSLAGYPGQIKEIVCYSQHYLIVLHCAAISSASYPLFIPALFIPVSMPIVRPSYPSVVIQAKLSSVCVISVTLEKYPILYWLENTAEEKLPTDVKLSVQMDWHPLKTVIYGYQLIIGIVLAF